MQLCIDKSYDFDFIISIFYDEIGVDIIPIISSGHNIKKFDMCK